MKYLSESTGRGGIYAKMVADSISPDGIRLSTLELNYPRFIHAEFMTHRAFSRNASSNRAIPTKRLIDQTINETASPIHWGKNKKGMQADEEFSESECEKFAHDWQEFANLAVQMAKKFADAGLHKQVANRVLEPFQFIRVVVTATEWKNFFSLRLHPDAQPEIQELARVMKEVMDKSEPAKLEPGDWHLPYVRADESELDISDRIKISVARCARVSYLNHDNSAPNIDNDIALHDRLLRDGHMSPLEHQGSPMRPIVGEIWEDGVTHYDKYWQRWSGNFRGWIQYRQIV